MKRIIQNAYSYSFLSCGFDILTVGKISASCKGDLMNDRKI
ncbi:MAG: hypothetical protein QMD06_02295 [Candidatus Altarchaeum sp.]|nr:hypothetical protein [Candidatus Altarchaeum sp.]